MSKSLWKNHKNQTARFDLRMTNESREQISKLAKRLKVKESEAVRRAVKFMIEAIEKGDSNGK